MARLLWGNLLERRDSTPGASKREEKKPGQFHETETRLFC